MSDQPSGGLEYLVPRRISQGYEFAPGWGFKQVGAAASGILAGGVVFGIAHLLKAPIPLQVFPLILLGAAGVAVARPMPDGSTMLDFLTAARSWMKKRKLYLYDWSREDV